MGWHFIVQFMVCFLCTEYHRRLGLSQRRLLLGYLSQPIFVIFQSSSIGFKSRESPGHSKTDIPLISIICFADLGYIQKHCLAFIRILYWHVYYYKSFGISRRGDVSHCLTIHLAHYGIRCGGTNHETVG